MACFLRNHKFIVQKGSMITISSLLGSRLMNNLQRSVALSIRKYASCTLILHFRYFLLAYLPFSQTQYLQYLLSVCMWPPPHPDQATDRNLWRLVTTTDYRDLWFPTNSHTNTADTRACEMRMTIATLHAASSGNVTDHKKLCNFIL
jgi:hypothetical protein